MRWLIAFLVLALVWLQYRLWVGEGSLADVRGIVEEVGEIVEDLGASAVDELVQEGSDDDEHLVRRAAIRGGSGELRVATDVVDGLAERSVRMRVATRSGAAPVGYTWTVGA